MAGENFLIGVDVQLDQATQQIGAMTDAATRGAQQAEDALSSMGDQAEETGAKVKDGFEGASSSGQQFSRTSQKTSAATNTVAHSFRGAGAAISGASAALGAMGGPVGPIATVGSSLAALAVSGAGPLALAVTGLVALAGVFAAVSAEASEAEKEIDAVEASIARMNLETRALRTGRGIREQELVEEIRRLRRAVGTNILGDTRIVASREGPESVERLKFLEKELRALRRLKEAREAEKEQAKQSADATERSRISVERIVKTIREATRGSQIPNRDEIDARAATADTAYRARRAAERMAVAAGVAARSRASAGLLGRDEADIARQRAAIGLARRGLELDIDVRGNVRDEQRITLEQQLRTEQHMLRVIQNQVELRRREAEEARQLQAEERAKRLQDEEDRHFAGLRERQRREDARRQDAIERTQELERAEAERERQALSARYRAPGLALASGIEQGLSQALQGQLDDPLAQLGALMQRTAADSVAAGVIEGLGVKDAAANLTEGISNFISSGLGGPSSAPGGAR